MRTSAFQYDLMMTFMEQHGDISKPIGTSAQGRLKSLQKWAELADLLNADGNGDTKTIDKWKKVWADLKNNTKKKAARINKSASGTGGGPALTLKLTPLEERVLRMIGVQAATGLPVQEAGLTLGEVRASNLNDDHMYSRSQTQTIPSHHSHIVPTSVEHDHLFEVPVESFQHLHWSAPGPSTRPHIPPPPLLSPPLLSPIPPPLLSPIPPPLLEPTPPPPLVPAPTLPAPPRPLLASNSRGNSSLATSTIYAEVEIQDAETVSPTRTVSPVPSIHANTNRRLQPDRSGQTTPRRARLTRRRRSPRRPLRPMTRVDQATQNFLHSDEEWRKFKIEQQKENMFIKREQVRIRELEVQANLGWQDLGSRAINLIRDYINKQ